MAHLAQHSSVRTRDTFNREIRAVDIPLFIHRHISFGITVLRGNLTVFKELVQPLLRRYKTAFTMGCGVDIYAAGLSTGKPGRLVADDLDIGFP